MEYIFAGLGLALLVGLYIWSYSMNEKCERPEGAEDQTCHSCHSSSCSSRKHEIKQ